MFKDAWIAVLLAVILMLLGVVFILWASVYAHVSGDFSAGLAFWAGVFFAAVSGLLLAGVLLTMLASRHDTGGEQ